MGVSTNLIRKLEKKIKDREFRIAIVGLGYVGLPLAVAFAREGIKVIGIDIEPDRVRSIQRGRSYLPDVESRTLARLTRSRLIVPGREYRLVRDADIIIVCVPTPLSKTKDPDLSFIMNACEGIRPFLKKHQLLVVESTVYPGMTEEVIRPLVEKGPLKVGENFFLAFSPERIDPGNLQFEIRNTPKVVGGVTRNCRDLAVLVYRLIVDEVIPVSSPRVAEMSKLLENTFRSVNIALVNEMAIMCDKLGVDVWEVISAASTKPFGFMTFYPGPGLGGHCIPVDPHYLSWKLRTLNYKARFVELAAEVNSSMPEFWVGKIQDALNRKGKSLKRARVLILGVSYKRDVGDLRESPALDIIKLLLEKKAQVSYMDPFIPELRLQGRKLRRIPFSRARLAAADCAVITADHSAFDYQLVARTAKTLVDTRNAVSQRRKSRAGKSSRSARKNSATRQSS
jgi:UDP-N-acetyl-D-glucosamine dehydrogenase